MSPCSRSPGDDPRRSPSSASSSRDPGPASWLATVRGPWPPAPDADHRLRDRRRVPHFVVGEGIRKGRNLAADGRCVIATGSSTRRRWTSSWRGGRQAARRRGHAVRRIAETLRGNTGRWKRTASRSMVPTLRPRVRRRSRSTGWSPRGVRAPRDGRDGRSSIGPSFRSRRAGSSTAPEPRPAQPDPWRARWAARRSCAMAISGMTVSFQVDQDGLRIEIQRWAA